MHCRPLRLPPQVTALVPALALAALAALAAPWPAAAAWISEGNAVATSSFDETTGYTAQRGQGACIAPDSTGGAIVAYLLGGDSLFVSRLDGSSGSRLWNGSSGIHVNPGGTVTGQPRVVADGLGGAWIVWKGTGASGTGLYAQLYNSAGTRQLAQGGIYLGAHNGQQNQHLIGAAATPSGKLIVARTDDSVRVMRVRRTGVVDWDASAGNIGTNDFHPMALLADGEGAVLAWLETLGYLQSGVTRNNLSVLANRIGEGGAAQWGLEGKLIFGSFDFVATGVSADWNGSHLFVTWTDEPAPSGGVPRVRAQKLDANGTETWNSGTEVIVRDQLGTPWANHAVEMHPRVVAGVSGGCVIGWVDARDYNRASGSLLHEEDLHGQRLSSGGTAQWGANGLPLDTTARAQVKMRMVPDGEGGAILVYENNGCGTAEADIRARRIGLDGVQDWSVTLNDNLPLDLRQEDPSAAPDGRGGVLAAWTDLENDATQQANVRATHRNAAGSLFVPAITVTAPNGGERFAAIESVPIRWTANFGGNVRIEFNDAGGARQLITASTANDGAFDWNPSSSLNSTQLRVYVLEAEDNVPEDGSDADFAICPGVQSFPSSNGEPTPRDVAVGDFNEDGIPDLAVAHSTGLRIHLGQGASGTGNGQYTLASLIALSDGGRAVVTRDFNEDGILDLAVSHASQVSILLGAGAGGVGNGSFGAPAAVALGTAIGGLVAADFNDDGVDDLALTARASDSVVVLLGGGGDGRGVRRRRAARRHARARRVQGGTAHAVVGRRDGRRFRGRRSLLRARALGGLRSGAPHRARALAPRRGRPGVPRVAGRPAHFFVDAPRARECNVRGGEGAVWTRPADHRPLTQWARPSAGPLRGTAGRNRRRRMGRPRDRGRSDRRRLFLRLAGRYPAHRAGFRRALRKPAQTRMAPRGAARIQGSGRASTRAPPWPARSGGPRSARGAGRPAGPHGRAGPSTRRPRRIEVPPGTPPGSPARFRSRP